MEVALPEQGGDTLDNPRPRVKRRPRPVSLHPELEIYRIQTGQFLNTVSLTNTWASVSIREEVGTGV